MALAVSTTAEGSRGRIERRRVAASEGISLELLHLRIPASTAVELRVDERFGELGIETNGRLLDLAATTARWGAPVGRLPEELLAAASRGAVGFCPTNFGWQHGAFLVDRGELVAVRGDRSLDGGFLVIGRGREGWDAHAIDLVHGRPARRADEERLRGLEVGLEVPAIVRAGRPVPRVEWVAHPRLLADLRNVFDFARGRGIELDPELWVELRNALPVTAASALALERGGDCREARALRVPDRLRRLLADAGLDHITVRDAGNASEIVVRGPLPATRLPLVGVGVTAGGALDVTVADGRRPDCPGATIDELARAMAERGVVSGGLGSAGGDVAVLERTASGTKLLNVPSTVDVESGRPTTRRVPALLLVAP
jgi:hypothetical protein